MYEIFQQLLNKNGVTAYKVSKETGISTATLSDWKLGRSTPKNDKMKRIADYFDVTIDYLMTGKDDHLKKETTLTSKDEKDIFKKLNDTLEELDSSTALMFDGEILDEETRELLRLSIENTIRTSKITAKKKFTPKKYRKDND